MSALRPTNDDIQLLRNRFAEALGDQFQIETDTVIEGVVPFIKDRFDIVILKDDTPFAVVDLKSYLESVTVSSRKEWLIKPFKEIGIPFGILYFGQKDEFYLFSMEKDNLTLFTFNGLISAIQGGDAISEEPLVDEIATGVLSCMPDELTDTLDADPLIRMPKLFTTDTLCFDQQNGEVSLNTKDEDDFFRLLLPNEELPRSLCRYTTLNSLFITLKNRNHCLCSLTCMNDKGEISYSDKFIHYGIYAYSHQILEENNERFILSCCNVDKIDDLTMWRLYGDQGRGVCLEYDINPTRIDNERFFLAPVSYGLSKNKHPQLEFIRNINQWEMNGWRFKLNRWHIWKHFFKSYLFKDEHEYRLMLLPSTGDEQKLQWIMDSTNSIVSRVALFGINEEDFPLKLRSLIVGPKCPEQESNVDQLEFMNRKQKVMQSNRLAKFVRASNITDYR